MLVLSRRVNEKILIPAINAAVQVVSLKGGAVRLGIEAPPEVVILREELAAGAAATPPTAGPLRLLMAQLSERMRVTGVGLGTVQLLLEAGKVAEANEALARLRDDFQLLRRGLDGELEEPPPPQPRKSGRALVVEDDRYQCELLAGFLRMAGLEVDTAGDGSDALDYLHTRPRPDVVLMDMGLPRCDGATAVRAIRRDPSLAGLRIYAVTGSPPDAFDLERGPAGIDRWFQKPLDPSVLLQDLQRELDAAIQRDRDAALGRT